MTNLNEQNIGDDSYKEKLPFQAELTTQNLPNEKIKKPHGLIGRSRPPEVRAKISAAQKGVKKQYDTYLVGKSGPNHPSFIHGKGATRDVDRTKNDAWIKGVLRTYNYSCFLTGEKVSLECHHLIGWWNEPTRYEIENGVALAAHVHKKFHDLYGRGNNTPEQFEEFCQKYYNISNFPWRDGNYKPIFTLPQEEIFADNLKEQKRTKFNQIVQDRNHVIVSGEYENLHSELEVCCPKHNHKQTIFAGKYKNSKFGLSCCAKEKQSVTTVISNIKRTKKKEF